MKLSQDPTARARLRLLRPWLNPTQFSALQLALDEVEVRPRPSLAARLAAAWHAGRIAWLAGSSSRGRVTSEP